MKCLRREKLQQTYGGKLAIWDREDAAMQIG